jgi:hypothetical protein
VRRQSLVASAVLTAALALVALPGVAGSQTPSRARPVQAEALQSVRLPASDDGSPVEIRPLDAARESAGRLDEASSLIEPGTASAPAERPSVNQPTPRAVTLLPPKPKVVLPKPVVKPRVAAKPKGITLPKEWKRVMSGLASWYDNGTTAMRLPKGTRIKICGAKGCVVRVVRDWGPARYLSNRVVDLTPQDFVKVTGRSLSAGLAPVTVYIY